MSLFIFDKDGTICQSKTGQKFINSVDDQELIPGVKEKIEELKAQGHKIAIASNQGGVAFGYMSSYVALAIMNHAANLIGTDYYYFCAFHPEGTVEDYKEETFWRKPNPGMLMQLMLDLEYTVKDTVMVGDREEDKLAAENSGVKFIHADDFFNRKEE